ncbi:hypothetical protein GOBAR_AA27372 [Gossypium barbadense]|uniref:Uncharacterized protein n=1 Tax=Gossypium barbadense TaxID=3634 RepID=A0A2P5WQE1_GOSBA|nr:hypothetical protein GOBAR_AA27372 [Gossypium barbadense]
MGSCVSRPEGCIGQRSRSSKKKSRKRRKTFKKRAPSRLSEGSSDNVDRRSSFTNPTFQGCSSVHIPPCKSKGWESVVYHAQPSHAFCKEAVPAVEQFLYYSIVAVMVCCIIHIGIV